MSEDLENFKHKILFAEIHRTERSDDFSKFCKDVDFCIRHGFYRTDQRVDREGPYVAILLLSSGVIQREKLIKLCSDLKSSTDWKKLAHVVNEGTENYYENWFQGEIESAKKLILKLRPLVIEDTKKWTREQRANAAERPEGRVLKGWFVDGTITTRKTVNNKIS